MIEQDTIQLLRECDAGVKMGIKSIDDVIERAQSSEFKKFLTNMPQQMKSQKTLQKGL